MIDFESRNPKLNIKHENYWFAGMFFFISLLFVSSHHDLKDYQPKHTNDDIQYSHFYKEMQKSCVAINKLDKYKGQCSEAISNMKKPMVADPRPESVATKVILFSFYLYMATFLGILFFKYVFKDEPIMRYE